MGLISVSNINNGDSASDSLFNTRFGAIVNEINGNLDQDNIKDSSITTAKINNASVTPAKMGLTKTVDANGWTVYDYGSWKEYEKRFTGLAQTSHVGHSNNSPVILGTSLPVGKTLNQLHIQCTLTMNGNAPYFVCGYEFDMTGTSTTMTAYLYNVTNSTITNGPTTVCIRFKEI